MQKIHAAFYEIKKQYVGTPRTTTGSKSSDGGLSCALHKAVLTLPALVIIAIVITILCK